VFSHTQLVESIETTTIPPKMPPKSKNSIEQEGRILLAISNYKKRNLLCMTSSTCLYDIWINSIRPASQQCLSGWATD